MTAEVKGSLHQDPPLTGGRGGFTEFDVELKFAKIQNSYVEGGWVGGWGGLVEIETLDFSKFELSIKFHEPPTHPPTHAGAIQGEG